MIEQVPETRIRNLHRRRPKMKKRDMILIGVILFAALILWVLSRILIPDEGSLLRITVDHEIYGEYPLDQDQTIVINDTNVCEIKDGKVKMTEADCPDHLCMKTAAVTKNGGTIVCLPNRVFLEVVNPADEETVPDVVAS